MADRCKIWLRASLMGSRSVCISRASVAVVHMPPLAARAIIRWGLDNLFVKPTEPEALFFPGFVLIGLTQTSAAYRPLGIATAL